VSKSVPLIRGIDRVSAAIHPQRAARHQRYDFSARDPLRIKGSFDGTHHERHD
jgi:hypothetical protein